MGMGNLEVVRVLMKDSRMDPNIKLCARDDTLVYVKGHVRGQFKHIGWKEDAIKQASYKGLLEVVKLLLRCPKVHLGVADEDGKTELDYARGEGHWDILNAIQSRQSLLQQGRTC